MNFSIKDFLSKCDQIRRKLRIWPHLLVKSLMENFILCAKIYLKDLNKEEPCKHFKVEDLTSYYVLDNSESRILHIPNVTFQILKNRFKFNRKP